jgi:short-subunit dehydrogenase
MPTALITGASAGLGADFARLFAADRHHLLLVARRKDRLDQLAAELTKVHGIQAHVLALDLQSPDAIARIVAEVDRLGLEIEFLVNNAGFGDTGSFVEADANRLLGMLQVNVMALTALTRALLPRMVSRGHGRVLNLGSTAGFQPGPYMAVYYASKAYVNSFTEALSYELKGTGVTATVSCPGATATEFGAVAGNDKSALFKVGAMGSEIVAAQAYHAMLAGRPLVVHGALNAVSAFAVRLAPRWLIRTISAALNQTKSTARELKA